MEAYAAALESKTERRVKIMISAEIGSTYERLALINDALTWYNKALTMHKILNDLFGKRIKL